MEYPLPVAEIRRALYFLSETRQLRIKLVPQGGNKGETGQMAPFSQQNRTNILEFIRLAMKPARYSRDPGRYEPMRAILNQALAFAGSVVDQTGELKVAEVAQTLPEAQQRARESRAELEGRGVHPDVLTFCRAELLADDYFQPCGVSPTR